MTFVLGNLLNFIADFQFMSSSLDKLVIKLSKENLKYTSEEFTGKKFSLMSQKGVYPYDYMNCFKNMKNCFKRNYHLGSSSIAS